MAGKSRTPQGLVLGLVLVAFGVAALAVSSHAETSRERRAKTAQSATPILVPPKKKRPQAEPVRAHAATQGNPPAPLTPEDVQAITRAQSCLTELGYYKGAIDGKRGKETWAAYWQFKQDHGLKAYSDLLAQPVQEKIASLCKAPDETAALDPLVQPVDEPEPNPSDADQTASPEPGVTDIGSPDAAEAESADNAEDANAAGGDGGGSTNVALAAPDAGTGGGSVPLSTAGGEAATAEPKARLDLDCLPEDLLTLLRRYHGASVSADACPRACLPPPKGLTQAQLDALQISNGLMWCRSCVPIDGHLALDDVRRIEREGKVEICATPAPQMRRYGEGATDGLRSYMRIRELYRALPPEADDPQAFAVVIGNRSYDKLPKSVTSYNDADAVYAFLTEHLGYRPDNIIDLRDAKKADFERLFGAEPGIEGDLARLIQSEPAARVLVYYSGLGATDGGQNETYLLPVDSEAYREETDGYKMSTLYANLGRLEAKSVLVLLDTDYAREHGPDVLAPNLPESLKSALPRAPMPRVTVISAADRGQHNLIDVTYDIGLFTRYVIEGLAGNADLAPIGNGDGEVDDAEIYVFTATLVNLAARKSFGLLQQPVYSGLETSALTSARALPAESTSAAP
jgi:hypothetical protein